MIDESRRAANAELFDEHRCLGVRKRTIERRLGLPVHRWRHRRRDDFDAFAANLLDGRIAAGERRARWAIWASIVALMLLALAAWPYLQDAWD